MRLLLSPLSLLALALAWPFHSLHAEWRVKTSKAIAARSGAVAHAVKTVADGVGAPLRLHLVTFDRTRASLRVIDRADPKKPASLPATVAEGVRAAGGMAGINGGYFQRDHSPLGLVVSGGVTLHPLQHARLLSGLLVATSRGAKLLRTAEYRGGSGVREALQAGPFLVHHGKTVAGLNSTRPAERTVLLADRRGVAALLITGPVTLSRLGTLLSVPGLFPELKIERALNLDGGSSTALWVAGDPAPFSHPEWKRVRTAVAVVPRR